MRRLLFAAALALGATSAAQELPPAAELGAGTRVMLKTVDALSSKTNAKGDFVRLVVAEDVASGGIVLIAAGTEAVGQVSDSREKGGLGVSGKLSIRPLHVRVGDRTVRLNGASDDTGKVTAGAVAGLIFFPTISGKSAVIPAGAVLIAQVERTTTLPAAPAQ